MKIHIQIYLIVYKTETYVEPQLGQRYVYVGPGWISSGVKPYPQIGQKLIIMFA